MTTYIQNYGFTKTTMNNNGKKINNEIQWNGDYNGKVANLDLKINDNGHNDVVSLQLTNNDLIELFGTKPVEMPLDERLYNDFLLTNTDDKSTNYSPMVLEGALIDPQKELNIVTHKMKNKVKHKSKKHKRINTHKRRQTYRR
jgi:hypothetical protein